MELTTPPYILNLYSKNIKEKLFYHNDNNDNNDNNNDNNNNDDNNKKNMYTDYFNDKITIEFKNTVMNKRDILNEITKQYEIEINNVVDLECLDNLLKEKQKYSDKIVNMVSIKFNVCSNN